MSYAILEQFRKINTQQEKLMVCCQNQMAFIQENQWKEAEQVQKQVMLLLFDLEKEMKALKEEIVKLSKEYGVQDETLSSLYPFMKTEEKEEIMACQRYAITYEQKIKNQLKNNEHFVQSKMMFPEILRQSVIESGKENGEDTTFINRKY